MAIPAISCFQKKKNIDISNKIVNQINFLKTVMWVGTNRYLNRNMNGKFLSYLTSCTKADNKSMLMRLKYTMTMVKWKS